MPRWRQVASEIVGSMSRPRLKEDCYAVVAAGQKKQAAMAQAVEQQRAEYARQKTVPKQAAKPEHLQREQPATAPLTTPYFNPLEQPAYNATNSKKYVDSQGRVYWIDIWGRRHYD